MPWKETSPMNERVKFVAAMLEAEETFGELSAENKGVLRRHRKPLVVRVTVVAQHLVGLSARR